MALIQSIIEFLCKHYPFIIFICIISILIFSFLKFPDRFLRYLSHPIKKIIPENLRDLLEKYDGDNEHKGYKTMMAISYVSMYAFVAMIFLKTIFTFYSEIFASHNNPLSHGMLYEIILHIDVAGIITGFLGILVGIVIALMVEGENIKEKLELKQRTAILIDKTELLEKNNTELSSLTREINDRNFSISETVKEQSEKFQDLIKDNKSILNVTNEIVKNYTALQPKHTLIERLDSLKNILKISIDLHSQNELYIMNYSADFSYVRSHNVEVVLNSFGKGHNDLSKVSKLDYHEYYRKIEKKNRKIYDLFESVLTQYRQNIDKVHFAIMSVNKDNLDLKSKYEKYLEKATERSEIIFYDEVSDDVFVDDIKFPNDEGKVFYAFAKRHSLGFTEKGDQSERKAELVTFLAEHNIKQIETFEGWGYGRERMIEMDTIPFQFIVSKSIEGTSESKALITFANIDGIGKNAGIFGFETTDSKVIANLVYLFKAYQKSQEKRNADFIIEKAKRVKFKQLFNAENRDFFTILKFKSIDKTEFYEAVPKSDIKTAVALRTIFLQNVNFIPVPIYIGIGENFENVENIFENHTKATFISIGLFGSGLSTPTVAEYISSIDNTIPFELVRKNMKSSNSKVKTKKSDKNTLYIKWDDTWTVYEEKWTDDTCEDNALLAKIIFKNCTIIIIGGLNHFGSECIGAYLLDNWETIGEIVQDKQFMFLFNIPKKGDKSKIEIINKKIW